MSRQCHESEPAFKQKLKKPRSLYDFVSDYPRRLDINNCHNRGANYDLKKHFRTLMEADSKEIMGMPIERT